MRPHPLRRSPSRRRSAAAWSACSMRCPTRTARSSSRGTCSSSAAKRLLPRSASLRAPSSPGCRAPWPGCGRRPREGRMPDLEQQLTALAGAIEWPPNPRLRIFPLPARRPRLAWVRPLAYAMAAAFLIVAVLVAYTPTREAIASWVTLHVIVHRVQGLPAPFARPSGSLGQRLDLGTPTTLDGAKAGVTWRIRVPSSLGTPHEVLLKQPPAGPSGGA